MPRPPRINFADMPVPPVGDVSVTETEPGKALVSIGRTPTRFRPEGVKHLGVLTEAEAIKVVAGLTAHFQLDKKVRRSRAA